jgi:hypothetical protein
VRDHDDINTIEFTLDLVGFDRAAAHDAGAAGRWDLEMPSMAGRRPSASRARICRLSSSS